MNPHSLLARLKTFARNWAKPDDIRKFMLFLALVYIAEGAAQPGALIYLPFTLFLKDQLHWSAEAVQAYSLWLTIPWVIKPVYGLISDFFPIFGSRRKIYLFITNAAAVFAYVWLFDLTDTTYMLWSLMVASVGMAASSALCQAVMVEHGKTTGQTGRFVSQQWLWFAIALTASSFIGGFLVQIFGSAKAVHYAALITAVTPIGVMVGCWFLIKEPRTTMSKDELKASARGFARSLTSPTIWVVATFVFLWFFSPGFGSAMLYYQSNVLKFDAEFLGLLGTLGNGAMVLGSLLYMFYLQHERTSRAAVWLFRRTGITWAFGRFGAALALACSAIGWLGQTPYWLLGFERLTAVLTRALAAFCGRRGWQSVEQRLSAWASVPHNPFTYLRTDGRTFFAEVYARDLEKLSIMKALIYLSIVLGVLAQAAFVLQMGKVSAILITVSTSIPQQIALLTMLTLVARVCPDKSEGFTYALIMSVYNLSTQYSATLGAGWYDSVFAQNIIPLIWISAGITALCFLLVPFLPKASLEPQPPPNPPNANPPPAQSGSGGEGTP